MTTHKCLQCKAKTKLQKFSQWLSYHHGIIFLAEHLSLSCICLAKANRNA